MGSVATAPEVRQYRSRLNAPSGSARLDALHTDFSAMRAGILCHDSMGSPTTWVGTPRACRWAATERPYGPAPMTAVVLPAAWKASLLARITDGRLLRTRNNLDDRARFTLLDAGARTSPGG